MVKILSQAGISLADMYQVEGSIAGIDELDTRELGIIHEVGATVFSERFRTTFRRVQSQNVAQDQDINLLISNMPEGISRILGVQVFANDGTRVLTMQVSLNDRVSEQDFPIWVFDAANIRSMRLEDEGTVATFDLLIPEPGLVLPCFATVEQTSREMRDIAVRGRTTGFGAGSVQVTILVHFAFTFTSGVSAFGARVPSW